MAQNDIAAALSAAGPGGTSALVGRPQSAGPWSNYGPPPGFDPDQPIRVQSADGAIHEFPAGTAPHLIDTAMQNYYQSQTNAKGDTAGAFAQGATDLPIVGPMIQGGAQRAAAGIRSLMSGNPYDAELEAVRQYAAQLSQQHPAAEGVGRLAGTIGASVPLAMTGPGAAALGIGARTLPGQMLAGGASGAGIGTADALVRGQDPVSEGGLGGLIGAALPPAARAIGALASPLLSNISARINPAAFAQNQVARALIEGGQTPAQIDAALAAANREGQGVYTAADAMGNAGQRMLSAVARAPGEGRTDVVNALESRQAGQGGRIAGQLAQGFDSPETAAQTEAKLTGARDTAADTQFDAARDNAGPIDLTPAIDQIDRTLAPGLSQIARPSNIANDSIENALQGIRDRLTDGRSMLTDFTAVQRVRGDLADQVQAAVQGGQGNRARLLGGVLRQMDAAMEDASPGFLQANKNFAQASRNIEAVGQGETAAMRGRTEDTIPQFNALPPEGQEAFRSGYVDPLIAQTQGAAFGANKARPLINDAFAAESSAMAPGAEQMQRQLAREQQMFETRSHALGGSRTADNLADQAAMGIDPSIIGHVLTGNHLGAIREMLGAVSNGLTGNTAAVRQQVARILLARGDMAPGTMQSVLDQTMQRIQGMQRAAQTMGRGTSVAIAGPLTAAPRPPSTALLLSNDDNGRRSPLYAQGSN